MSQLMKTRMVTGCLSVMYHGSKFIFILFFPLFFY
jgi:hypothetical protein